MKCNKCRGSPQVAYCVRLFGSFDLSYRHSSVQLRRGSQRLVAFVALNGQVCRTEVAGVLWPEVDDAHANGCLRTAIWQTHRYCPGLLVSYGNDLRFSDDTYVDTIDFDVLARCLFEEPQSVPLVELTRDWIGKRLLPGWYDEWVIHAQERFWQLQIYVLEAAAEELLARGKPGPALWAASSAVNAEPLRESAHRLVVRIHLSEGNLSAATAHYRHYASMLYHELGVRPTKQLQALMAGFSHSVQIGDR